MSYKGLCVGGILAGDWESHATRSFKAKLPDWAKDFLDDKVNSIYSTGLDDFEVDDIATTYVHVVAEDVCEFWVPEGKNLTWALQELFRCYRRKELALGDEPELE